MILVPSTISPRLLPQLEVWFKNMVKKLSCNKKKFNASRTLKTVAVVLALPCYSSRGASSSNVLSRCCNRRLNLERGAPVLICTLLCT